MIDSYEVGDKLTATDFVSDYYMPMGEYQYVEITDIDGDKVELTYHNDIGHIEDVMYVSKDQMARMLGWEDDPLLGAGDAETELYNMQLDILLGEGTEDVSDDEVITTIQNAPTLEEDGDFELLETDEGEAGVYVEKNEEQVVRAYVFRNLGEAKKAFRQRA